MKAIILAGGLGTRFKPITDKIPKPLIPLNGKPLAHHVIDILKKFNISEITLSLCYMADKIKKHFKDGSELGIKINCVVEKEPMGTAGPLILSEKFNETFIMVNGDNLFDLNLKEMIDFHKENKAAATIALTQVENVSHYGAARLEDKRIIEFVEKPTKEEAYSNWINSGYYVLEPEVFDIVKNKKFAMMEKDVFPLLAKEKKLYGFKSRGIWFDIGDLERYEQAKKLWRLSD